MKLYQVIIILSSLLLTNCASNRIQTVKETQQPFIEIPSPVLLGESHYVDSTWNAMESYTVS